MRLSQGNIRSSSRYLLTTFFCSTLSLASVAQSKTMVSNLSSVAKLTSSPVKPLTVGDKVPDIAIENVVNYPTSIIKLSDLKGKLLILDFWEITCTSCIRALPQLEALQTKFKDKIQVLTITKYGTKEQIKSTLQRLPLTKNVTLPIALNNSKLKEYFPFEFISHVVWIDATGKVRAITGSDYFRESYIQEILNEKEIDWPIKKDVIDFDESQPIITFNSNNKIDRPASFYYSAVTGHINGISSKQSSKIDSSTKTITQNYFNQSLLDLCELSISGYPGYIDPKKLILEVKEPLAFILDHSKESSTIWEQRNTYCYTLSLPSTTPKAKILDITKSDVAHWLNALFKIKARKEKRIIKCLALIQTKSDYRLLISKGGTPINDLDNNNQIKSLTNFWFSELSSFLNSVRGIPYVIDKTEIPYNQNIDINLKIDSFQDIPLLRTQLQRFGLDLIETEEAIEVYVISETN